MGEMISFQTWDIGFFEETADDVRFSRNTYCLQFLQQACRNETWESLHNEVQNATR
jgi:hypothetical protein